MTDTEVETRDDLVLEALASGQSLRKVRRQFALSEREFDSLLERLYPLSTEARLRTIRGDLALLNRIIETLFQKAVAGDINAATAAIRGLERKAFMLGTDCAQKIDLQVIPKEAPSSFEQIREAIFSVARGQPGDGNGADHAVGVPSDSDGKER